MTARAPLFHGVSAFPITPADPEGRADADDLGRILDRLARAQVDSVGLLGSTGGYAYLTLAERRRITELAAGRITGRIPLIVGISALRSDDAAALARHAQQAGAQGLLLAPMSYTPLTEDEVFRHFATVAAASDLPLCIYNNPSTTHFRFSLPLIRRLSALPGIAAIKMPLPADGDLATDLARLRAALPQGFTVGYSGDWGCAAGLLAGADGWFSVAAGLWPVPALRLARAASAGDREGTERAEAAFLPLWDLFRTHGSLRVVHAAARLMGLTATLPPRPILPLPDTLAADLQSAIRALDA